MERTLHGCQVPPEGPYRTWNRREFLGRMSALAGGTALGVARRAAAEPPAEMPDILLISIDSLRADHLHSYGHRRWTSPTIDALAQDAVTFKNVIVQGAWTLPSMASMLTGQYVGHHGVVYRKKRLTEAHLTAAKIFKSAGFATAAVVENPYLTRAFGFDIGFDHFVESEKRRVTSPAVEWLEEHEASGPPRKPFFMWLHYLDPHKPYAPPRAYKKTFVEKSDDPFLSRHLELSEHLNAYGKVPLGALPAGKGGSTNGLSKHDVGYYISQYDGEIRYIDDQLERLFEGLGRLGLWKECVIVVTADHGQCLGEHNMYFDHGVPWEPVVKIPLVFRVPGANGGGRTVEAQVREIDILPTLLDLVGLKHRAAALGEGHFDGESFACCFDGGEMAPRPAFGQQGMMNFSYVRIPPWKYIEMRPITNYSAVEEFNRDFFRGRSMVRELFNIEDDPFEARNLIEDLPKKAYEMRAKLFRHQAAMARKKCVAGKAVIDEKTKKRLLGLGYMH